MSSRQISAVFTNAGDPDSEEVEAPICQESTDEYASRARGGLRLTRQGSTIGCLAIAGLLGVAVLIGTLLALAGRAHGFHTAYHRPGVELEEIVCTAGRGNCMNSKCCVASGSQCYQQDETYAQCRPSCTPGPDPTHWDGKPWSCDTLGARTPGEPLCGDQGQNCWKSQCCKGVGIQCYSKNASWATCKAECAAGSPDPSDVDATPWECQELGERTPGAAAWVQEQCSSGWDNCLTTRCCKVPGEQCYKQNDYFAECKAKNSCVAPWSCEEVGTQTPTGPAKGGKVSSWALEQCSKPHAGCAESRCCIGMDVQCYAKGDYWAQCLQSCTPGPHPDDKNETWTCKELGLRSYGLATKGSPSLFCFSVLRTTGYEVGLMGMQKAKNAGIFACDDYSLLTADGNTTVGGVPTIRFQGAPIVQSVDNTAGNTALFVNAWNVIIWTGKWQMHAFTVKVDPDAVFFPERLRWHVSGYLGQKMFVINCHKGDMVYGALEIYSFAAIQEWSARGKTCPAPNNYGEDKYMTTCMDFLGVARIHDESVLGDKLCDTFFGCQNGWNTAFHPFKDPVSWEMCWNQANQVHA